MNWNELNIQDRADLIKKAVKEGIYNMNDIKSTYNSYANGGYKPSNYIKDRITKWEGSSMKTNRSFDEEAKDFNRYIPKEIQSKLSQKQLDALYSYGYNVGMYNLKKRVLPTLNNYINNKATKEDVQRSMWASRDNELRGLTIRRNAERELFGGNYRGVFTGNGSNNIGRINNNLPNYNPSFYNSNNNYNNNNNNLFDNMTTEQKDYINNYKGFILGDDNQKPTFNIDEAINNILSSTVTSYITPTIPNIEYNNIQNVTPNYSYAQSMLSDFDNALYGNNTGEDNMFGKGGPIKTYQGDINHLKDLNYQRWRANLPINLRAENDNYDLYNAYKSGAKPKLESDDFYHLPSRDPRTNRILKKATYHTYGTALREDMVEGYLPVYKNGETYTYPLPWIKANGGGLNKFEDGGDENKDYTYVDADNLRHRDFLNLTNIDGKLMDNNNNHYNLLALDREHTPVIQGTNLLAKKMAEDMAYANAKKYFDPNTTFDFIGAAAAPIINASPSNVVGSIKESNNFNDFLKHYMLQDTSGFFTENYAKEHPYISTLGNLGGDILSGMAFDKGIDLYRDFVNNSILYKKGLTQLRKFGKKIGIREQSPLTKFYDVKAEYNPVTFTRDNADVFDYYYDDYFNKHKTFGDKVLSNIVDKDKSSFFEKSPIGNKEDLEALKTYYSKYARKLTKEQEENIFKQYGDRGVSMMRNNPEYFDFINENPNMNPFDQTTIDAFLKRQGLSLRGVHTNNPMNAEKFLTQTEVGRYMSGGDRLNTNGGLYTSNSKDIGNRFKNAETGKEDGYLAEVFHKWNIDKSLPIEEQLNQWRQKVLYDASFGKNSLLYPLNKAHKPLANKMLYENPNIEAVEAEYGRSNGEFLAGHERGYLPLKGEIGTKGKPVSIKKVDFFPSTTNQNGRWGAGVADDNFFINKELNNTTDFIRDARILLSSTYNPSNLGEWNRLGNTINRTINDRINKTYNLAVKADKQYKKAEKIKDFAKISSYLTGALGIPIAGISMYINNKDLNYITRQLDYDDRSLNSRLNPLARKDLEDTYYSLTGTHWKAINKKDKKK